MMMRLLPPESSRTQFIVAILVPALTISLLVTLFTVSFAQSIIKKETLRFANALTEQAAITSVEYLINGDGLSLNIILRRLCSEGDFKTAKIDDSNGDVIARVGTPKASHLKITKDIIFKTSVIGHLEIGFSFDDSFAFELLAKALITFFILSSSFIIMCRFGDVAKFIPLNIVGRKNSQQNFSPREVCYLVLKENNFDSSSNYSNLISKLCDMHSGERQPHGKDTVISFQGSGLVERSITFALHVKALNERLCRASTFEGGIDVGEDLEATRKHAAYLAGISKNQLLISHRACRQCQAPENKAFQLKVINHTLIEEDELFVVEEQDSSAIKKTLRALSA